LKHAGAELRSIADLYAPSARLLTGTEATPESYAAANPSRYDVIHFAAHAEANARSPLDSAVILSAGRTGFRLSTRDVSKLPLRADLVTLSACRGAGAQAFAGEGLVGFSWAYLRSGALQVVAGLWQADDESTAKFMRSFYEAIRRKRQLAPDALRFAKLELIRGGGAYAKPYYWGPFQIFVSTLDAAAAAKP
jgi:CHAT domain-containing protein